MVLKESESRGERLTSQMVLYNIGRKIHVLATCNAQSLPELGVFVRLFHTSSKHVLIILVYILMC